MRIDIEGGEKDIHLAFPTRALCNSVTASIAGAALRNSMEVPELSAEQVRMLFQCLLQCKKNYPDLVLVDIDNADGTKIKIQL